MSDSALILGGTILAVAAVAMLSTTAEGAQVVTKTTGSKPRGLRNKNPGNVRFILRNPWNGQIGIDGAGYGVYSSMALGTRAAGREVLQEYAKGNDTIQGLIAVYAPASENNVDAYVNSVCKALRVAPKDHINFPARIGEICLAMFKHENGASYVAAEKDINGDPVFTVGWIEKQVRA